MMRRISWLLIIIGTLLMPLSFVGVEFLQIKMDPANPSNPANTVSGSNPWFIMIGLAIQFIGIFLLLALKAKGDKSSK